MDSNGTVASTVLPPIPTVTASSMADVASAMSSTMNTTMPATTSAYFSASYSMSASTIGPTCVWAEWAACDAACGAQGSSTRSAYLVWPNMIDYYGYGACNDTVRLLVCPPVPPVDWYR
jgi:hypothetical protein